MKKDILSSSIEDQKFHIHKEHREWGNQLEFYADEIKFFEKELEQVMRVNNRNMSIVEHVREYQRILEKKKLMLFELQEEIKYQKKIFNVDEIVPDNIEYHLLLKERMNNFFKKMEELKPNFKRFASHRD